MSGNAVVRVDPSNREQAKAWDGDEGEYWAANADRFDQGLATYHRPFMRAAAIGPHDQVLDIGCGTGQTTRDAARAATSGSALGVDLSSKMIDLARQLAIADGLTNAEFEQADAQVHPFTPESFDVAISRTGAMFFGDQVAAFANIGRALRPSGRLVLLTWQPPPGNEWIREFSSALAAGRQLPMPPPDAPGPFSLADPDRVKSILTAAGFQDVELDGESGDMWFGRNADEAYDFVLGLLGWMLEGLDGAGRTEALHSLRATIEAHEKPQGVIYESATWTIRATRS